MASTNPTDDENDHRTAFEFDYAWNWFQYHAAQRLTAFNFFLIIVGLLLVAFAQAIDHGWIGFGVALGLLGALVAAGFLALDVRNEELVNRGLDALAELELGASIKLTEHERSRDKHLQEALGKGCIGRGIYSWIGSKSGKRERRERMFTHRFWLRCVIAAVGIGFTVAAGWALVGFPGV